MPEQSTDSRPVLPLYANGCHTGCRPGPCNSGLLWDGGSRQCCVAGCACRRPGDRRLKPVTKDVAPGNSEYDRRPPPCALALKLHLASHPSFQRVPIELIDRFVAAPSEMRRLNDICVALHISKPTCRTLLRSGGFERGEHLCTALRAEARIWFAERQSPYRGAENLSKRSCWLQACGFSIRNHVRPYRMNVRPLAEPGSTHENSSTRSKPTVLRKSRTMNRPRAQTLTVIALAAAVALVAILGVQNRSLKSRYGRLLLRSAAPYPGLSMPAFDAVTIAGDSVTIGSAAEGQKQLLLFFTSTCPMSRNTLPAWNEIALEAEAQGKVRVFGIQLDTLQLKLEGSGVGHLQFPVLRLPDSRLRQWYRVRGVPVTVLLNHEGRVLYSRLGEMTERPTIDSVIASFRDAGEWSTPLGGILRAIQ